MMVVVGVEGGGGEGGGEGSGIFGTWNKIEAGRMGYLSIYCMYYYYGIP